MNSVVGALSVGQVIVPVRISQLCEDAPYRAFFFGLSRGLQ